MTGRRVGGFFGLDLPPARADGGVAGLWGLTADLPAWVNATSALAALVAARAGAVWLPGFLCPELAAAVPPARRRFYALTDAMDPDPAALDPARPGDLVLAVAYFGRAPGAAFRAWAAGRPDLEFVEDCAQAFDPGPAWGDWRLYSPRKVLGVSEGGLLIPVTGRPMPPAPAPSDPAAALARLAAPLARFEHPQANALWHPMNQAREAAHAIEPRAISRLARHLLTLADPGAIAARRRENFAVLAALLPDLALIPGEADFVPLGFPVRLPPARRDAVLARLHAQGFFPAVHWRRLPVGRDGKRDGGRNWAREWGWADSLATLPCDPRATPEDLRAMAAALRAALGDAP